MSTICQPTTRSSSNASAGGARVERATTSDPNYDSCDHEPPEHLIAENVFRKIARDRTAGERGIVNYSYTGSMRSTTPPDGHPMTGWWLRNVMQLWDINSEAGQLRGGAFLYWYFKRGSDEQPCPVYWTKYNNDYHVVAFMLAGRWITMMSRYHETLAGPPDAVAGTLTSRGSSSLCAVRARTARRLSMSCTTRTRWWARSFDSHEHVPHAAVCTSTVRRAVGRVALPGGCIPRRFQPHQPF